MDPRGKKKKISNCHLQSDRSIKAVTQPEKKECPIGLSCIEWRNLKLNSLLTLSKASQRQNDQIAAVSVPLCWSTALNGPKYAELLLLSSRKKKKKLPLSSGHFHLEVNSPAALACSRHFFLPPFFFVLLSPRLLLESFAVREERRRKRA